MLYFSSHTVWNAPAAGSMPGGPVLTWLGPHHDNLFLLQLNNFTVLQPL